MTKRAQSERIPAASERDECECIRVRHGCELLAGLQSFFGATSKTIQDALSAKVSTCLLQTSLDTERQG